METIAGEYGMVVITRSGTNPERFVYESDLLNRKKVCYITSKLAVMPLAEAIDERTHFHRHSKAARQMLHDSHLIETNFHSCHSVVVLR